MSVGSLRIDLILDPAQMLASLRQSQQHLSNVGREASMQMRILRAEFGAASARIDASANSVEQLRLRQSYLGQRLEQQRSIVRALNDTYQRSVIVNGANSEETRRLELRLARAREEEARTERQIRETNNRITDQSNRLNVVSRRFEELSHTLRAVGAALTGFGLALGAGLGASVKVAAEFEAAMSEVGAVSGNSGEELQRLSDKAREMGKSTSKSAKEAANAMSYMALAGWDATKIIAGIEPILRLSEAGNLDLAKASDLVTDSMAAMGIPVQGMPAYLDALAQSSRKSNTAIDQMMDAYLKVGGTFNNLKVPLAEGAALLGVIANRGQKGAEAGKALSSIIVNLTAPAGQAAEALKKLGFSAFEGGRFKGLERSLFELKEKMAGLTQEQRNQIIAMVAGKEQLATFNNLLDGLGKEYSQLKTDIEGSNGALFEMAFAMQDNLLGSVTQLKSALEETQIALGRALIPAVRAVTKALNTMLDAFNSLPSGLKSAVAIAGAVAGALLLLGGAVMIALSFIPNAIAGFVALRTAIAGISIASMAAKAVQMLNAALATLNAILIRNPIVAGLVLIGGALAYVAVQSGWAARWLEKVKNKLQELGLITTKTVEAVNIEPLVNSVETGTEAFADLTDATKEAAKETKKFLAAFDEVYTIPDDNEDNGLDLPSFTPPDLPEWGQSETLPDLDSMMHQGRKIKLPEFEWQPIPPFPGWPLVPPMPALEPIALPQPLIAPEPIPILQPVLDAIRTAWQAVVDYVTQPVEIPAWIPNLAPAFSPIIVTAESFMRAWQAVIDYLTQPVAAPSWISGLTTALAPAVSLVNIFAQTWQTAAGLISGAISGLQTMWAAAFNAMVQATNPFITAGAAMALAWGIALDGIRNALDSFREWAKGVWERIGESMKQPIHDAFGSLRAFWENHKVEVLAIAGTIIIGLIGLFGGAPGKILTALAPLLPQLGTIFSRIPGLFSNALSRLPSIASSVANTVSSILSNISSRISSVVSRASSLASGKAIPAYATGTSYHPGGLALVGEKGPEILNLPAGTSVTPMSDMKSSRGNDQGYDNPGASGGIDYERLASIIVDAIEGLNLVAKIDTGSRNMVQLSRAMQPALVSETARRGGR